MIEFKKTGFPRILNSLTVFYKINKNPESALTRLRIFYYCFTSCSQFTEYYYGSLFQSLLKIPAVPCMEIMKTLLSQGGVLSGVSGYQHLAVLRQGGLLTCAWTRTPFFCCRFHLKSISRTPQENLIGNWYQYMHFIPMYAEFCIILSVNYWS